LEKVFLIAGKFAKKPPIKGQKTQKMSSFFSTPYQTKHSRNAEIGTNVAHGVKMMVKLFVFRQIMSKQK